MLLRREMRDGAGLALVTFRALFGVETVGRDGEDAVALDAHAVQALGAGRWRGVLVVVSVRCLRLCLVGHGQILA